MIKPALTVHISRHASFYTLYISHPPDPRVTPAEHRRQGEALLTFVAPWPLHRHYRVAEEETYGDSILKHDTPRPLRLLRLCALCRRAHVQAERLGSYEENIGLRLPAPRCDLLRVGADYAVFGKEAKDVLQVALVCQQAFWGMGGG